MNDVNKKVLLKERDTNNNLYPITLAENVIDGDTNIKETLNNYNVKDVDGITLVKDENGVASLHYYKSYVGTTDNTPNTNAPIGTNLYIYENQFTAITKTNIYNGLRDISPDATNVVQERALYKHLAEMGNPRVFDLIEENIPAIKEYYDNNGFENLFFKYENYVIKATTYDTYLDKLYTSPYLNRYSGINYFKVINFNDNTISTDLVNLQGKNILDNTITADKLADDVLPKIKVFNLVQDGDNTEIFDYIAKHGIENTQVYVKFVWNNVPTHTNCVQIVKATDTNLISENIILGGELKYVNITKNSFTVNHAYYGINSILDNSIKLNKLADDIKFKRIKIYLNSSYDGILKIVNGITPITTNILDAFSNYCVNNVIYSVLQVMNSGDAIYNLEYFKQNGSKCYAVASYFNFDTLSKTYYKITIADNIEDCTVESKTVNILNE